MHLFSILQRSQCASVPCSTRAHDKLAAKAKESNTDKTGKYLAKIVMIRLKKEDCLPLTAEERATQKTCDKYGDPFNQDLEWYIPPPKIEDLAQDVVKVLKVVVFMLRLA